MGSQGFLVSKLGMGLISISLNILFAISLYLPWAHKLCAMMQR